MSFSEITSEKFFDRAYKTAQAYGFVPANALIAEYKGSKRKKITTYKKTDNRNLQHLSTLLQFIFERQINAVDNPLYIFHSNIDSETKSAVTNSKKPDKTYCTLSVIGIPEPYAEAIILSCAHRIFKSLKSKQNIIRINSMGTREDSKEYFSRLGKTLRKVKKNIRPECKRMLDRNQLVDAHALLHDEDHAGVSEYITPTLRLLSDGARIHFEKVIEYLEAHELPYEFAPDLVELTQHGIHTIFEVSTEDSPLHAHGGRYDTLPFLMYRRRVPVASITITLPEKTTGTYIANKRNRKPKAFFVHAGDKARLRALRVLSQLCDSNIPVAHRLHCKKVSEQLNEEAMKYPCTIIFGQEEAENNTICIRKTDTRVSKTMCLDECTLEDIKSFLRK